MNVLIAVDNSSFSNSVLSSISKRPWPVNTMFKFIAVTKPAISHCMNLDNPVTAIALLRDRKLKALQIKKELSQKASELLSQEWTSKVSVEVKEGDFEELILEAADSWSADLLVVGFQRRKGLVKLIYGCPSDVFLANAKCNVELVNLPAV